MSDYTYEGQELDIFAHARNWKAYWSSQIAPFIKGDVLEVGAGKGTNTALLLPHTSGHWTALEPDPNLAHQIRGSETIVGSLDAIPGTRTFDTIIYIDVLEHIEDHKAEVDHAARHLPPGGRLIVLSPAHQSLYTPFDRSIGHFRRYSKRALVSLNPEQLRLLSAFYLDSVGLILSLGNRLVLKQSMPTVQQIRFWDRFVIPLSRVTDRILARRAGKSVVAVWQKP
jgi:SAM-dependent methyltransferase